MARWRDPGVFGVGFPTSAHVGDAAAGAGQAVLELRSTDRNHLPPRLVADSGALSELDEAGLRET